MAEISLGRYNFINGYHRLAKAQRVGRPERAAFMTTARAYVAYVEYWNSKIADI